MTYAMLQKDVKRAVGGKQPHEGLPLTRGVHCTDKLGSGPHDSMNRVTGRGVRRAELGTYANPPANDMMVNEAPWGSAREPSRPPMTMPSTGP